MNTLNQSLIVLAVITASSLYAAQQGWLGPYGMPGDIYHLIILIAVLFFTWMIYASTVLRRGESDD